jgi:nucleoside-diphosphate-sugar epimerase
MNQSITITGANGFVGTNILKYLKNTLNINTLSVRYIQNQVLTLDSDILIHLSGKAHDLKNVNNYQEYFEANFELTKQLFDSFLLSDMNVFIFMSSVKATSDSIDSILTENHISNPQTYYGKSKLLAENYILSKEIPKEKRVYILRPCMIYGPGNKGNLNLLNQFVSKGLPWPLGAFKNRRSFCSIDNLCYLVKQLIERPEIPSGVYNLADDETLSTNELIELIASTTNRKVRILSIPKKLIKILAGIGYVFHLPLNTERLDKLTENFVVSNAKIKNALQIEKLPISSKEGLTKTIKSFN